MRCSFVFVLQHLVNYQYVSQLTVVYLLKCDFVIHGEIHLHGLAMMDVKVLAISKQLVGLNTFYLG